MSINIQRNQKKRVVIVGGGLGGLRLAEDLYGSGMQVVLIDKNNFHQFPPLIYQIASAGIDPSSISFPFRQIFRKRKDFYFRCFSCILRTDGNRTNQNANVRWTFAKCQCPLLLTICSGKSAIDSCALLPKM